VLPLTYFHFFEPLLLAKLYTKITGIFCLFSVVDPTGEMGPRLTRHCKAAESDIKVEKLHPYHPHLRGTTRNAVRK